MLNTLFKKRYPFIVSILLTFGFFATPLHSWAMRDKTGELLFDIGFKMQHPGIPVCPGVPVGEDQATQIQKLREISSQQRGHFITGCKTFAYFHFLLSTTPENYTAALITMTQAMNDKKDHQTAVIRAFPDNFMYISPKDPAAYLATQGHQLFAAGIWVSRSDTDPHLWTGLSGTDVVTQTLGDWIQLMTNKWAAILAKKALLESRKILTEEIQSKILRAAQDHKLDLTDNWMARSPREP